MKNLVSFSFDFQYASSFVLLELQYNKCVVVSNVNCNSVYYLQISGAGLLYALVISECRGNYFLDFYCRVSKFHCRTNTQSTSLKEFECIIIIYLS